METNRVDRFCSQAHWWVKEKRAEWKHNLSPSGNLHAILEFGSALPGGRHFCIFIQTLVARAKNVQPPAKNAISTTLLFALTLSGAVPARCHPVCRSARAAKTTRHFWLMPKKCQLQKWESREIDPTLFAVSEMSTALQLELCETRRKTLQNYLKQAQKIKSGDSYQWLK